MLDEALFISDRIHARQVRVAPGREVELHFREVPASEFLKYNFALVNADEDARAGAAARLIAASLCEPDGSPALSLERAAQLRTGAMDAIFRAVLEVNSGDLSGNA